MLVLLPPSETKADGGRGAPLDLDALSFPELNPARAKLADALAELAGDVPASVVALGITERQAGEVEHNARLWTSPTMPALRRYTGVLYDALDVKSLTKAGLEKAHRRLAVTSSLFGVVSATDPIPAYRLSGGNSLPSLGTVRGHWKPVLEPVLQQVEGLVVDLRSGTYSAFAKLRPDAVTVRVVTENARGERVTVSHFNKAYKGRLARELVTTRAEPSTVDQLAKVIRKAGLVVERTGEHALELVTEG
ncbi:peroxide stress protein YaaA [Amycolatopsis sp. NBRC 101858]|uniref:peroxide stress protein YaaA n=1 Tax=Amycolatopsis sp. NBRC 101858 TaxID=3032200 RepID=UPI0024A520A3|nr:peroxide stress protein YaaA [Amycolatopsis sp. NBRC 101858]GLY44059.1 peroxide stress protein YaaA [Amycolatopsis sp. NBRC 101858]